MSKTAGEAFSNNPEYIASIGMASAEMSVVENQLGRLLAAVLNIDPALGQTLYLSSHTAFGRLASLDITASQVLSAEPLARMKALLKRTRELLVKHNDLHGDIWKSLESPAQAAAHAAALADQIQGLREVSRQLEAFALGVRT